MGELRHPSDCKMEHLNIADVPADMLDRYLRKLFQTADLDGNGVLDRQEFAAVLKKSGLQFSPQKIMRVMAASDTNMDGVIQYDEFVPAMMSLLGKNQVAPQAVVDGCYNKKPTSYYKASSIKNGTRGARSINRMAGIHHVDLEVWDPHFHIWDISETGPHDAAVLFAPEGHERYTIGHYEAAMDTMPKGFYHSGGVFLEAMSVCHVRTNAPELQAACVAEAEFALDSIATSTRRYVMVASACLEDPDVEATLATLTQQKSVRGIRQIVNHRPNWPRQAVYDSPEYDCEIGDLLQNPQWIEGFALLERFKLSFDLQLNPHQFLTAAELLARFPRIPIIINHLGCPTLADLVEPAKAEAYWSGLQALAKLKQCTIKISMLAYTDPNWDKNPVVLEAVARVIDLFGVNRCMVASNHPADLPGGWTVHRTYRAFSNLFQRMELGPVAQRQLFSETARRTYASCYGFEQIGFGGTRFSKEADHRVRPAAAHSFVQNTRHPAKDLAKLSQDTDTGPVLVATSGRRAW